MSMFYTLPDAADGDQMEALLRKLEQNAEDTGWDLPVQLYSFCQTSDGELAVSPRALPGAVQQDPPAVYQYFVNWLRSGMDGESPDRELLEATGGPQYVLYRAFASFVMPESTFVGLALQFEGWSIPNSHENVELFRRRMVHMHPDRIESRQILAMCTDGRICSIKRNRGEAPEYWDSVTADVTWDPDKGDLVQDHISGTLPNTLRLHCDLVDSVLKAGEPERI